MGAVSGTQILIVLLIVILLFGAKKIPELAKGMGSGIKNFKKAMKEDEEDSSVADAKVEDKSTQRMAKKEDSVLEK